METGAGLEEIARAAAMAQSAANLRLLSTPALG